MTERDRQRAIQLKLARSEAKRVGRIPTGFPALDQALEGGLPRGRITEIFGGPSCGKTTLALSHGDAHAAKRPVRGVDRCRTRLRSGICGARSASVWSGCRWRGRIPPRNRSKSRGNWPNRAESISWRWIRPLRLTPAIELEVGIGESGPGLQGAGSGLRIPPFGRRGGQNRNGHSCFESNT